MTEAAPETGEHGFAAVRLGNLRASLIAFGIDPDVAAALTLPEASKLYGSLTNGES